MTGVKVFNSIQNFSRSKKEQNWFFVYLIIAILMHFIIIFLIIIITKKEKISKKTQSAEIVFTNKKPVVKTNNNNFNKPKKPDFFAEHDQSASKQTRAKAYKSNTYKNGTDDSQKTLDPLGIYKLEKSELSSEHISYDIEEGNETKLNAWQWRHAGFFNRIKEKIGKNWSPQNQIARYDPQGQLLGNKDRVTILRITIDQNGNLTNLELQKSSQVAYLDEEALNSFKNSQPFLFPPKELFNNEKTFSFEFGFYLQINSRPSFDFNW
jgi:TonB family protein